MYMYKQVTIFAKGSVIRAEQEEPDLYASIDFVCDKVSSADSDGL